LFQKSQTFVFGEGLNLFEFENIFELDSNLGFKIQIYSQIFQNSISICSGSPNTILSHVPSSQPIFLFLRRPISISPPDLFQPIQPTRPSSPSSIKASAAALGWPHHRALLARILRHPSVQRTQLAPRPLHLPAFSTLFPLHAF
jgi:hypothetical protein